MLLLVSHGWNNPYVMGALFEAKKRNAKTVFLCCNLETTPTFEVDVIIRPIVGPEVITGSTRMKAWHSHQAHTEYAVNSDYDQIRKRSMRTLW